MPDPEKSLDDSQGCFLVHTHQLNRELVCFCLEVPEEDVREAVRQGAGSIREVRALTGAGAGCRGCFRRIKRVIRGLSANCPAPNDEN